MASTQRSVPASVATSAGARPLPVRPGAVRAAVSAGPGRLSAAPGSGRRDGVRPGARAARLDRVAAPRSVRGGCPPEAARAGAAVRAAREEGQPLPPLRLTERGRRVVAGLSMAIGLCIAAGTVVTVELGDREAGLQLAGDSTVVVQPGDTLWSLAQELAPREDPRAVVDAIVDLNGLHDVDLVPGMELELP